jgi:IclR family acetate operon transcriptional repressor
MLMRLLPPQIGVDSRYVVAPVLKAMRILHLVCEAPQSLTLNDLSVISGLPKTTVFRYLRSFLVMRMVEHDVSADRYRAGLGLWWLSHAANPYERLRQTCRPTLKRLQQRFNETVNLGVLSGNEVIYLDIVESERSLRMQARIGACDPTYSTALGKALIAFRPSAERDTLLPDTLVSRTARTITDRTVLLRELDAIQRSGIAIDRGENEEGSYCVAAPIKDSQGTAIAAISISAPASRMGERVNRSMRASLIKGCGTVSRILQI